MSKKTTWTDAQDMQLRRLYAEGNSWEEICRVLDQSRPAVLERARRIGARPPPPDFKPPPPDPDREPLSAGDRVTWAAITRETVLHGVPFRRIRLR